MGKDFGLAVWGYFLEGQAFTLGLEMETDTEVFGGEGRKSENETESQRGGRLSVAKYHRKIEMRSKWKEQRHKGKNTVCSENRNAVEVVHYC